MNIEVAISFVVYLLQQVQKPINSPSTIFSTVFIFQDRICISSPMLLSFGLNVNEELRGSCFEFSLWISFLDFFILFDKFKMGVWNQINIVIQETRKHSRKRIAVKIQCFNTNGLPCSIRFEEDDLFSFENLLHWVNHSEQELHFLSSVCCLLD